MSPSPSVRRSRRRRPGRPRAGRLLHRLHHRPGRGARPDRGRGRRLPGHHRARLRRDHHRGGAAARRDPRLDRPGQRAGARRRAGGVDQADLGRQRQRLHATGSTPRSRSSAPRRRCGTTTPTARRSRTSPRRSPTSSSRPTRASPRRSTRSSARSHRSSRSRRTLDHPVADPAGDGGEALGRSDLAAEVNRRDRGRDRRRHGRVPAARGHSLIFGYLSTADLSTVGIYAPEDPRVSLMHDLGMVDAPVVADAIKPGSSTARSRRSRPPSSSRTCSSPGGEPRRPGDVHRHACSARSPRSRRAMPTPRRTSTQPRGVQPVAAVDPLRHRHFLPEVAAGGRRHRDPRRRPGRSGPPAAPGGRGPHRRGAWSPRWWSAALSVLVGSARLAGRPVRLRRPGVRRRSARLARTVPRCWSSAPPWARRRVPAGADPQPAGRPRHPRHQRRRLPCDGAGDLGLRRLRRSRRTSGSRSSAPPSPPCSCTSSPRSAVTARRR